MPEGVAVKRKRILAFAVVLAGLTAVSYGQGVGSNVVGFTMVRIARGDFGLLSYDFDSMSGAPIPSNVIAETLPSSSQIYVWDLPGQRYVIESFVSQKGGGVLWSPGTNLLRRGYGFWLKVPSTAPSNEYSVYMLGQVPSGDSGAQTTVGILEGFNLIGFPYPTTVVWTNTALAESASVGDVLYTYSPAGYQLNTLVASKGGDPYWTTPTQTMNIGRGYWFLRQPGGGSIQWTESKPYTWP